MVKEPAKNQKDSDETSQHEKKEDVVIVIQCPDHGKQRNVKRDS